MVVEETNRSLVIESPENRAVSLCVICQFKCFVDSLRRDRRNEFKISESHRQTKWIYLQCLSDVLDFRQVTNVG